MLQRLVPEHRQKNFNVTVTGQETDIVGERMISITHNGWQSIGFGLTPSEARKMILVLEEFAEEEEIDLSYSERIMSTNATVGKIAGSYTTPNDFTEEKE